MREWLTAALADLPLLRNVDDTAGAGSRLTYLMASFDAPGWSGAALYRSPDGLAWSQVGRALGEAAWGATVNALGVPLSGSPAFRADAAPARRP